MQGRRLSFGFGNGDGVELTAEGVANYFWDYNTVEMILLACSILVCLAGVMFESDRFVGRDDLDYQRLMISVGVMLVIMFSCFYYGIVLLSEVTGHTPEWVKKWMAKNKWGGKLGKNENDEDDSDDELGIEMAFKANPMHRGEEVDAEIGGLKGEMGKIKGERDEQAKVNKKLMEQLKKEKEKNAKLQQVNLANKKRSGSMVGSRRARKGFGQVSHPRLGDSTFHHLSSVSVLSLRAEEARCP